MEPWCLSASVGGMVAERDGSKVHDPACHAIDRINVELSTRVEDQVHVVAVDGVILGGESETVGRHAVSSVIRSFRESDFNRNSLRCVSARE